MVKNLAAATGIAAAVLIAPPAAEASPLSDCVARHNTAASADYCASLYGPTKTVTQTKTSTVTSTKREVDYIPVEAEVDPGDFAILAALLAAAVAVGAGGTLIWTRTRAQKPAHAGWTAPPPDAQHAQAAPNAHAQADAHAQQQHAQYAPPPSYAPEPEPTYDAHAEPCDAPTRTERAQRSDEGGDPFGGLF